MRTTPVAPTRTRVDVCWLVREDAMEGADYDVERVTAFWKATGEQDWKLCEDNQAGVSSRRYEPGPYAPSEAAIETFLQWYLQQLADA
jgi:Rieske 2Fe-2S family protein